MTNLPTNQPTSIKPHPLHHQPLPPPPSTINHPFPPSPPFTVAVGRGGGAAKEMREEGGGVGGEGGLIRQLFTPSLSPQMIITSLLNFSLRFILSSTLLPSIFNNISSLSTSIPLPILGNCYLTRVGGMSSIQSSEGTLTTRYTPFTPFTPKTPRLHFVPIV